MGGRRQRWGVALAVFVALLAARTVDDARIVQAQAGVSAVLVIVLSHPERGWDRLVDAAIGAGVALVFSQLLFVPEPLRQLRRAESVILSELASGLKLVADALDQDDRDLAEQALSNLRALRDDLASLHLTRKASDRIVRHSITWRRRAAPVVAERERADQLDLLAGSCLVLTRTAMAVPDAARRPLAETVQQLADAISDLARDPGDRVVRQNAADRAGGLVARVVEHDGQVPALSALAVACMAVRMAAEDVMVASVDILLDESLGLEGRAGYYDQAGALVDMLQSHALHVLAFLAMEPPSSINAQDVRDGAAASTDSRNRLVKGIPNRLSTVDMPR